MSNKNYSARYDVNMAKKYGIEAATLYSKLLYLMKYSNRTDGFCWKSAKELESEIGLSKYQQSRAEKILVKAGLIETKVTYIAGTLKRCKHFKIINNFLLSESKETELSESKETELSLKESKETILSESKETSLSLNNSKYNNSINNNTSNIQNPLNCLIEGFTDNEKLKETLQDFIIMRKTINVPLTERALKICFHKLEVLGKNDAERIAILEQSIERGWRGIFALKEPLKAEKELIDGGDGRFYDKDGNTYV